MSDPMEGGGGPSIMDRMNQGQLGNMGAGAGGGEGEAPGTIIDVILRKIFRLNGHSTGGLDSILNLGSVFSGLALQGKSIVTSQLDGRGGVLSGVFSNIAPVGDVHGGPSGVDTSGNADPGAAGGGGGGGDAQAATLASIPTAAIVEAAQPIQGHHVADAAPAPRASSAARASSRSEGGESMGRG